MTGYFADPDGYRWEVAYNPTTGPETTEILGVAAAAARIRAARQSRADFLDTVTVNFALWPTGSVGPTVWTS